MKKILFGLAIALATPAAAHAAEAPKKACCCKEMKDGCCCDKKGEDKSDHADHKDMQH
ncbi:hypothetical protein WBQ88_01525 [Sphingopyxis sp. CCNWLW253]|uniref:hypothetical protein n=1 Tax=unclassified Sphingopyxis TaxID=2614943 RepID=UPI003012BD95